MYNRQPQIKEVQLSSVTLFAKFPTGWLYDTGACRYISWWRICDI